MSTVSDLCQSALKDIGVVGAGETMGSGDLAVCFKALNQLVDSWATERLTIYSITRTTWPIVSGTGSYTVGSGGDVNIARPDFITGVSCIVKAADPDLEIQLTELTDDGWQRIALKDLTSELPTRWYYNPTYPLGTLKLWPVPTPSSTLNGAIYAPTAVTQFAATSTSVSLPPGYERFIVKNLAVEVSPKFGASPSPALLQAAKQSKADIKRANIRKTDLGFDQGALIQVGRNNYTGFLSGDL